MCFGKIIMPSKQLLDKGAWQWVETVKPEDVRFEHIETAYRIKIPTCKQGSCRRNCKGNPQCLLFLGERDWFTDIADETCHEIEDPNLERRKEDSYVGLKNLGATCYVNSLLQLWFHNPLFRRAIFQWRFEDELAAIKNNICKENEPDKDITEPLDCVIGSLQYIFAQLQFSCRRYIDPSIFIKSLGLNTTQQQDAQEFSKLFISLLEEKLQCQLKSFVRDIIQDQFKGNYSYITKCLACSTESSYPSRFYELDLNIKGQKDLYECIEEFLKDEKLEGADQYHCGKCMSKQNAIRSIRLHNLPSVLNLQLLRFIYDRNIGQKRKLSIAVKFPEVLNMSKYMKNSGSVLYDLTAVLVHRGPSANSGHYVANIRNQFGDWFVFNDENIEKTDGKSLKLTNEDDLEDGSSKNVNELKATKGFHVSKNAYMLVYTKRSSTSYVDACEDLTIPESLHKTITEDNCKFEEWVNEMTLMRDKNVESWKTRQKEIQEIYKLMPVSNNEDLWDFIQTVWLTNWLKDNMAVSPIDNSNVLCQHQRLHPDNIVKVKRISSNAANILYLRYNGGPRLQRESLCQECVVGRCRFLRLKSQLAADTKYFLTSTKLKETNLDAAFWVGKVSMRCWKRLALNLFEDSLIKNGNLRDDTDLLDEDKDDLHEPSEDSVNSNTDQENPVSGFNEDIVCEHRNLSIKETSRRLVSLETWRRLKSYFPTAPEFPQEAESCTLCLKNLIDDNEFKTTQRSVASCQKSQLSELYHDRHRPNLAKPSEMDLFVINTEFVNEWRRFIRDPVRHSPVTDIQNSILLCAHGGIVYSLTEENSSDIKSNLVLITQHEWQILSKFFNVDVEIKVIRTTSSTSDGHIETCPGLCIECYNSRILEEERQLLAYDTARIFVCKVSKDDKDALWIEADDASSNNDDKSDPAYSKVGVTVPKKAKIAGR